MKKLLLLLVVLGFLKGEVKGQEVEWVQTISGVGLLTYVNDSLIYSVSSNRYCSQNCPTNLYQFNSSGKLLNSKIQLLQNGIQYKKQQRFIINGNRVVYSESSLILDQNLNITTVPSPSILSTIYGRIRVCSKDLDFIVLDGPSYPYNFTSVSNVGSITGSNKIFRDGCFYNGDCSEGVPYIDPTGTFYWSRCSYKKLNEGYGCSKPLNYIATNTVGGVITTYSNQKEAEQQSIMSFDKSGNVTLLPFHRSSVDYIGSPNPYYLPQYFISDSKGNMYILSIDGILAKYRITPWDSIWTRKLNIIGNGLNEISLDSNGFVYVNGPINQYKSSNLYKIDSTGKIVSNKQINNVLISDLQSDNKQSIYITSDTATSLGPKILDCYTMTSNFITKLYTGTIPSTPKLMKSGLVLKSNYPRGVTWYRNDSLLTSENDTFTLALRDGKYTFKAFCKQDTITFNGISVSGSGILQAISIPGASYQWSLNDVPIPNAISSTYSPTALGKYTVIVTFTGSQALYSVGRVSAGTNYYATYSTNATKTVLGINDFAPTTGYFSLYPNPATQTLTIKTAGFSQVPQAQILNALGQEVTSLSLSSELSSVDVSSFQKGIYSIKVGSQVQKLVVE